MRYTTVIDISDMTAVWRSMNARQLYLFMALRAGWHNEDRDIVDLSIRVLAADSGLTVSATRCALALLQKNKLIEKVETGWKVLKWICQDPPTPRTKPTSDSKQTATLIDRREQQIQEYQKKVLQAVRNCSTDELTTWLHELEEGRSRRHQGVQINANQDNVSWLRKILQNR